VGSVGRRWSIRIAAVLAVVLVTAVAGFQAVRPRLEAAAVERLREAARKRGWVATIGSAHLAAGPRLELRELAFRHGSGWLVEAHEVGLAPRWSWRGVIGRAALARASTVSVQSPVGLRVEVKPSEWAVESAENHLQVTLDGGPPAIALTVESGRDTRIGARFVAAPLSNLLLVLRNGCPLARLGTVDGEGELIRRSGGLVDVQLRGRSRGLAVAALSADGPACPPEAFGAPADVEAELRASVDPAAGLANISHAAVRTRGLAASAQATITGGTADPQVSLNLDIPRADLAEVLATAGLDLPAADLGSASLAWSVAGRLLDPASITVSQRLEFSPPAKPVPSIARLKEDFVHRVETPPGDTKQIVVSPGAPDFVRLGDVPPLFLRALLLAEDTDFYGHQGVDLRELPVALAADFGSGAFTRGASTISQQLAKNLFLTRRKTVSRKLEEAALALLLDSTLGKSRELEIYLNVIEWGPGIYGLGPAARYYFDRRPSQLTPRQMAFLVVLIPGPIKYQRSFASGEPTPFFDEMIATLLGKLQTVGALGDGNLQAALEAPLNLRIPILDAGTPRGQTGGQ
jgi:hypothetical protein